MFDSNANQCNCYPIKIGKQSEKKEHDKYSVTVWECNRHVVDALYG